jgi:hypothetical protein
MILALQMHGNGEIFDNEIDIDKGGKDIKPDSSC